MPVIHLVWRAFAFQGPHAAAQTEIANLAAWQKKFFY